MSWLRSLIAAGVRNPVYANVLMVCILAGGFVASRSLVTETYPEFSLDRISVTVPYPGASPEEVEQGVTTKIEEALEGIPGIKRVWSRAQQSSGLVMIELDESVGDAELTMLDIKDRVDRITTFPKDVERPVVSEAVIRGQVINVAVYGDASERAIKEVAFEIKRDLLSRGVASQVEVVGVRDYEISIQVSQEALLQYGISLDEVTGVVARNCADIPAGSLRTNREELTIRTMGQRYTAQEFEDLVLIARPDGTVIKLGQVARIDDGFERDDKSGRFQGMPAAMVEVFKTSDQDTSSIARGVREYVEAKRHELPEQLKIAVWADASREVDARIAMLVDNGIFGILLVVLVLSLFLDFRVSLYVALGVPVSFAGSLIVMHFLGQTLNMITLFGLIMVTGIIVDDAIVIADGFRGRISRGDAPALAAVNGPGEVGLPVIASSGTTIIAFVPLLFVVGIMGKFIAVLPVVVIAAIVFSSIEAFCILPSHLQHCLGKRESAGRLARARTVFRDHVEHWIEVIVTKIYCPLLRRALVVRVLTISVALGLFVVTLGLVIGGRIPFTLLPEIDGDMLRARVRFPHGTPIGRSRAAVDRLEAAAQRLNDPAVLSHSGRGDLVAQTFSVVGEWSGWLENEGAHLCEVMIGLMSTEDRRLNGREILTAWAEQTGTIEDAITVSFNRVELSPTEKPLEIRLLGDDLEQLGQAADEICGKLADYQGVSGIGHDLLPGRREVQIRLRPLARTLGVTLDDLARQLRTGFYGGEAVRIQRGRDEVRVQVRFPEEQRRSVGDIETLRMTASDGREIPFRELAEFNIRRGYAVIPHQGGQRRVRITADVDERSTNAERILASCEKDFLRSIPDRYPGVDYRIEGQHAQIIESLGSLFWGFSLALIAIYAVLAAMLMSYYQPVVIMAAIPLGFVGAVIGHKVMGYDLTIMSVFGLVALSGVVVNDSLVLLDQLNKSLHEGSTVFEAAVEAGRTRFRAVILTTLTTVAGLAPLLLERSTQAQSLIPMAISLVFGLAMATVLTLVVVPALYLVANDVRRVFRWLRYGGSFPTPEAVEPMWPSSPV